MAGNSGVSAEFLAATNTIVEETLQAIASVKAFANETFEVGRYAASNARVLAAALSAARWRAVFVAFFILALFGAPFFIALVRRRKLASL